MMVVMVVLGKKIQAYLPFLFFLAVPFKAHRDKREGDVASGILEPVLKKWEKLQSHI